MSCHVIPNRDCRVYFITKNIEVYFLSFYTKSSDIQSALYGFNEIKTFTVHYRLNLMKIFSYHVKNKWLVGLINFARGQKLLFMLRKQP